jgi:predicted metal-binding membrane protein
MAATHSAPLRRERDLILVSLALLATAAWAIVIWQSVTTSGQMMGLTMGMAAPLFLAVWVAMMVAMMFPAAAPMILMFASVQAGKRRQGRAFVPTWVFVGAYLLVWTVAGIVAYAAALGADRIGGQSMWLMDNGNRIAGVVLIVAGIYQLTPLKHVCLAKCRTPLAFIMTSWRDGYAGALRMGLEHGTYCLGCCWLLFVILFPIGMMNIAALAAVTLLIFAEKALPYGRAISLLAAAGLVTYGVVVILVPSALPSMMSS